MDGLKESKQAVGAEVLTSVQNLAPPTVLAQASRMNFSTRLFNLLVTNVPGPQFPLYALGRELQELFPVAFLPDNHALAVAIISYNGGIDFGLLGDYDAMPDLDAFAAFLDDARQELVDRATAEGEAGHGRLDGARRSQNAGPDAPRSPNTPGRTSRPRTSSPVSTGA
jgi:diacylglycerol O-acyltransferase